MLRCYHMTYRCVFVHIIHWYTVMIAVLKLKSRIDNETRIMIVIIWTQNCLIFEQTDTISIKSEIILLSMRRTKMAQRLF
jgi:hypothetical protein